MLLRHSAIYGIARGLPAAINFLALAIYTRLLTPEDYGLYALVMAAAALANAVLFRWLGLALLRFRDVFRDKRELLLSTILAGFLGLIALTGAAGLATISIQSDPLIKLLVALGIALLWTQAWFELTQQRARAQLTPIRWGISALIKSIVAVSTGTALAYIGWGPPGILFGVALGFLVPGLWSAVKEWRQVRPTLRGRPILRQLITYGLPLSATFALGVVVDSSDRLLLGWLRDVDSVGLYAVGYDLTSKILMMLMVTVHLAAYPLVVKALEYEGKEIAQEKLSRVAILLFTIGLPSTVGLSLLAPNVTQVFLGGAFRESAAPLIPLIAFGSLLQGLRAYYLDLSFQLGRRTITQLRIIIVAALVNIGLNLWWIPTLGIFGAAYATIVAYAVSFGLSWWLGKRVFTVPLPWNDLARVLAATLGMALGLWPVRGYTGVLPLLAQVAWGAAVFVGLALILNVAESRTRLKAMFLRHL